MKTSTSPISLILSVMSLFFLLASCTITHEAEEEDTETPTLEEQASRFEWENFKATKSYYVSPNGNDAADCGTREKPWASIRYAIENVPDDGSEIIAESGVYRQAAYITRKFSKKLLLRAATPYLSVIQGPGNENRVLYLSNAANIIIAGFEMEGNPGASNDYLLQVETCEHITLENNILHDSYRNDLLKINNMTVSSAIRGNMFYNQAGGGDEHIDANVVRDIDIEDNIFFNDFAASGRPVRNDTHPFVLVKSSTSDPARVSRNANIRRNVFLNWQGLADQPFLLLGEDAQPFHEAENVMVENNLFACNATVRMSAAFCIKGVKDVVFRANTVNGYVFHVSFGYGIRIGREGANPQNENIRAYNNIFSDPSGQMYFFSGGQKSNMKSGELLNNLFFNNGVAIEEKPENAFTPAMDTKKIVGDPKLASPLESAVTTPVWNRSSKTFAGGAKTIEDARIKLINSYGRFTSTTSAAIDAADPSQMPENDILCKPRDKTPDIGAYEY